MGILDSVESGKKQKPISALIYGPDGVGKTSFAADAPAALIADFEGGSDHLNVNRVKMSSYEDLLSLCDELISSKHLYESLVIDSLDWAEQLVWKKVCKDHGKADIESFGFGKGYGIALNEWGELVNKIKTLRSKMNVLVICHSQIKVFQDPTQGAGYDRYQLKLNEKAAALFREAVDFVLFANFEVFTRKDGQKTRAFDSGDGARFLFTQRRPSFDAKSRIPIPFMMPLSWKDFFDACNEGEDLSTDKLKTRISEMLGAIKDESLTKKVLETASGADKIKLNKIVDKLAIRMEGISG